MSQSQAIHITVLHALPGRLRVQLDTTPRNDDGMLPLIHGVKEQTWNARLNTLLIRYEPTLLTQEQVLVRVAAAYANVCRTGLIHIRHCEEDRPPLAASAFLALGCIGLDGIATAVGSTLMPYTRWISLGTTLASVFEHGYHELKTRGSFDPEVMSIVYLINSIGTTSTSRSAIVAWLVTFGRHLIPRAPREQAYLARHNGNDVMMTAVRCEDKRSVLSALLDGSVSALGRQERRRVMGL